MSSLKEVRSHFPMLNHPNTIYYFDNAATTLKPQVVIDAVVDYYRNKSVNVHRGDYPLSHQVTQEYDLVRDKVADFIGCHVSEVVFTSGASASLNLVAQSFAKPLLKKNDVILVTASEHASNLLPWFKVAQETGAVIEYLKMDRFGQIIEDELEQAFHDKVKIVAVSTVSNVLGAILPVKKITQLAHQTGAYVVCDGAQSIAHIKTDVLDLGVDFFAFSAHKMLAPTGVGVLYGKYDLLQSMEPEFVGGGSNTRYDMCGAVQYKKAPEKFETGTPAIEGVLGLGAAIDYIKMIGLDWISQREKNLYQYLFSQIIQIDHVDVYSGEDASCLLAFNVKKIFPQDVGMFLSSKNIAVRSGNHCSKILHEIMGATETVRASLAFYNTEEEIDHLILALQEITLEKCIDLYL